MSAARKAGVIGWPIEHSRSPLIHGYWLDHYRIEGAYQRIAVAPEGLEGFIAAMQAQGYAGVNVTIPHKAAVAAMCDRLTSRAARLGVVNTVWFEDEDLCGDTTDGDGFVAALDDEAPGWAREDGAALVLGAGGAAPPIIEALMTRGFRVTVWNRTSERARALAGTMGCEWCASPDERLATTDLLVNATAAGLKGTGALDLRLDHLPDHAIVDDIVYVPRTTALLANARARGLRTVGGLGMLLHQAVPGFERWFGVRPAVTPELRALLEADVDAAS